MTQTFGEVIKERRKHRGITLKELARKTGVSRDELIAAEMGQTELTPAQKLRIEEFIRRQKII